MRARPHFLAVDADSGFIVASLVAPTNDEKQTAEFLRRLDAKLARKPDGSYVRVPEIISDGHGSYEAVITEKYPSWKYAKIIKQQTNITKDGQALKKRIFGGHRRKVIQGTIEDYETFVNNRVEGANSAARDQNMRVHNKSKAFSKRLEQHIQQFALWVYAHNHILPNTRTKMTPALKARVDKTLRDENTLIRQMKMFGARLRDDRLFEGDYNAFGASDKPRPVVAAMIWLYHSFAQKASKLHRPSCRFCNHGAGLGGVGEVGVWLPFQTLEEASAHAERMTPGKVTACKHCLGERARPRHGL